MCGSVPPSLETRPADICNPKQEVARGISGFPKHLLPFPSEFTFQIPSLSIDTLGQKISNQMKSLDIQWQWRANMAAGVGFAMGNVWSRQARRKRLHEQQQDDRGEHVDKEEVDEDSAALGFKVQLKKTAQDGGVEILVRWLKGEDVVLFESFCGMLKRRVEER
jgi:23S rRNA (adenine1618-N6)-methyltransferase